MKNSRPILFLDFDGTLHPMYCGVDHYFECLPMLEAWLRRRRTVDVVISSSWREAHSLNEMREFFASDLRARVIGSTPVHEQRTEEDGSPSRFVRHSEIRDWLDTSRDPHRRWAALDDHAWQFLPLCRELVLCDDTIGLTRDNIRELDALLFGIDREMDSPSS